MSRVFCQDVQQHLGQEIEVKGWVKSLRHMGKITFIILRDCTGIIQCVCEETIPYRIKEESVIVLRGKAVSQAKAPEGFELHIKSDGISLLQDTAENLPFEVGKPVLGAGFESVFKHRAYSLRHERLHAIFHLQAEIMEGFRAFLRSQGFTEVSTPKIVASGTEGGSELFPVQYFEKPAYLAQSPQFYKQMMVGSGFERVFEVGKAYRAEEHNTARHINEYVSLDFEMGFIDGYEDLMNLETELLRSILVHLTQSSVRALRTLGITLPTVPSRIPRLTLSEAHMLLKDRFGKLSPPGNLDPEGERLICEWSHQENGSEWIFITEYPVKKRPFYAMEHPNDPLTTASFDLLFRGLEVTTGGQRIHSYDHLTQKMRSLKLNPEDFDFYLDIFKYGMPPHGGLAIGLERLTMQLCGLSNIREASLFPRDRTRLVP